jgi:hypothetical protein
VGEIKNTMLGKSPNAVNAIESFCSPAGPRVLMVRHLKMTSVAHQKLANLSSQSSRLKGNTIARTRVPSGGGERKRCEEESDGCDGGEVEEEWSL